MIIRYQQVEPWLAAAYPDGSTTGLIIKLCVLTHFLAFSITPRCRGAALMRRRRFIFVSPRVLPRSGLLPGVCADMVFVPRRGSLHRTCIPLVYAEMPSGQQVMVAPRPWVGTTPWYQPTANEDIAPPAHQMPSGHIRHGLKLIVLY